MTDKKSILHDLLALSSGTEIPPVFMLWCGISAISTVLGRRCWLDMGPFMVYPNLFIILVAPSGRCRKTTAILLVEGILRQLDTPINFISQRVTTEALIEAITITHTTADNKFLKKTCEGAVYVDELINFLNRKTFESGLAGVMIPLYDCHDKFEYRTKARGIEYLNNTCLGLLAGSTVEWIRDAIPIEAVGGGLTSRMIFVYNDIPSAPVARPKPMTEKREIVESIIRAFNRIQHLQGPITLTPKAWERYETIYNSFYSKSLFFEDSSTSGYASRRHVHLLKVALALAASEETIEVDERHVCGANEALTLVETQLFQVLSLITSSEKGILLTMVKSHISKSKRISRGDLLRRVVHRIDSRELTELLDTLIHSKQVRAEHSGGQIYYEEVCND